MLKRKNKSEQDNVTDKRPLTEENMRVNNILNSLSEQKSKIKACQICFSIVTFFLVLVIALIVYLMLVTFPASNVGINGLVLLWLLFILLLFSINYVIRKICRENKSKRKIEFLETRLKIDSDKDLITSYHLDRELKMIYLILES